MENRELFLKKGEERRLKTGHQWVFSNEIDTRRCPLNTFEPGDLATIVAADGKLLGTAYVNPNALICARILSRKPQLKCGSNFFKTRVSTAAAFRQALFNKPYYRMIYGESDGLPGVVVDRFGSILSVQITTAGMDRRQDLLIEALKDLTNPVAIVLKNDNSQRQLEGLDMTTSVVYGDVPESVLIEENGARYAIDVLHGQKTGWFYDHRISRAYAAELARGKRVLDLFCYTGAWAIPAALHGASTVTCIDASDSALSLAKVNATLNGVDNRLQFIKADVFDFLKNARATEQRYDLIVLDPPALIKRKKDYAQGFEAYRRLNQLALQVLDKNGVLISASCSFHLSQSDLQEILRATGRHVDRHLTFFAEGSQGPDHPIDPAIPETRYLKTFFCSVTSSL